MIKIDFLYRCFSHFSYIFASSVILFSYSELTDHFKPALNKGNNHSIKNIDFIYMINLDQRPEKFETSRAQLNLYGINPYRFSAVNGWELSLDTILDVGLKFKPGMDRIFGTTYVEIDGKIIASHEPVCVPGRTYFCHCMARGPIGICLSHLSILQDAWDSGYETIWIMEDDVDVIRNPHQASSLIEELDQLVGPKNWDILFTDYDAKIGENKYVPCGGVAKRPDMNNSPEERSSLKYQNKKHLHKHFHHMPTRFGAYSMIVRRTGMKKLLDFWKEHKIFLPYDMDNAFPSGIKRFGLTFDLVSHTTNALSDNGGPNYLDKINKIPG